MPDSGACWLPSCSSLRLRPSRSPLRLAIVLKTNDFTVTCDSAAVTASFTLYTDQQVFYRASACNASRAPYLSLIESVRLSVCPSHSAIVSKQMHLSPNSCHYLVVVGTVRVICSGEQFRL